MKVKTLIVLVFAGVVGFGVYKFSVGTGPFEATVTVEQKMYETVSANKYHHYRLYTDKGEYDCEAGVYNSVKRGNKYTLRGTDTPLHFLANPVAVEATPAQ